MPSGRGWNVAKTFSNFSVTNQLFWSHRPSACMISKSPSFYGIPSVKQRMQSVKPPGAIVNRFNGQEYLNDLELALWIKLTQESQARLKSISHIKYMRISVFMSHVS